MKKYIGLLLIFVTCVVALFSLFIFYSRPYMNNYNRASFEECDLQYQPCFIMSLSDDQEFISLRKAQEALDSKKYNNAIKLANEIIESSAQEAQQMQNALTEFPWESTEKIMSYNALNAMGVALLIKGKAYQSLGDNNRAEAALNALFENFHYAQCWIPACFPWPSNPAEEAARLLIEIKNAKGE